MLQSLPTLQYADLPSRWGISVQRLPAGLRVIVPPVKSWRYLPRGYLAAVLICGGMSCWFIWMALGPQGREPGLVPNAIIYGCIGLGILAKAVWRLRHQIVFDVTREQLTVASLDPWGRGERTSWQKREIGDVKFNPYNGKLLIRITGDDLLEYPICPQREVTRWVAETVRSAVFDEEFAPSQAPGGGLADFPAPRPPAHGRAVRYALAIVLAMGVVAGLVLLCFGQPIGMPALIVSLLGLVIICGLTYGTQEKEFFT